MRPLQLLRMAFQGGAAPAPVGTKQYATWDPSKSGSGMLLTNGNLRAALPTGDGMSKSTVRVTSGKWYWEVTIISGTNAFNGLADLVSSTAQFPGVPASSWGYRNNTGDINGPSSGATITTIATYTVGDVIGYALDRTAGTLTVYKNNVSLGTVITTGLQVPLFAAVGGTSSAPVSQANFGATALTYAPPAGYNAGLYVEGAVYSYLNPLDKGSNITLDSEYLTASCTSTYQGYVRAVQGKKRGKWYWETTYGPTAARGSGGCAPSSGNKSDDYLGSQSGIRYDSSGACYMNSAVQFNGAAVANNGVVGFAIDLDARTLKVYVGGVLQGSVAGGPLSTSIWMPAIGNMGVSVGVTGTFNPGPSFTQPVPSGYNAGWYEPHIFTTLDAGNKTANQTLSGGNLTFTGTAVGRLRGVVGKTAGKYYWESLITTNSGLCVGVCNSASSTTVGYPGEDVNSWAFIPVLGQVYNNGASISSVGVAADGSTVGCALDLDNGTFAWYVNNTLVYTKTGLPLNTTYYPLVGNSGATSTATMNFGTGQTKYAPPAGFAEGLWG